MVVFSFARIDRSASFDASNASPVSEAARATHESFESHLERAAATQANQSTSEPAPGGKPREQSESTSNEPARNESPPNEAPQNESSQNEAPQNEAPQNEAPQNETPQNEAPQNETPQNETPQNDEPENEALRNGALQLEASANEPVRQGSDEAQRDDGDNRFSDDKEATTASETSTGRNDEEVETDATPGDEVEVVTIAANEPVDAIQDVEPEALGDSHNNPEHLVATKPTVTPGNDEGADLEASLATRVEPSADEEAIESGDQATAVRAAKRDSSHHVEPANLETPTRQEKPSETNEEVSVQEFSEAASVAESTIPEDEPNQAGTPPQRHAPRGGVSPNQRTHETPNVAPKPVAVNVVETALDTANEDSSQQRRHQQETDAAQPIANKAAPDVTTTTSGTPSRFAQHLLARTEDPHGRGLSITNADQARFVDRVARAVQATGERGGTLRLRLSPPELGSLTLEVKVQGGIVSARVETDTSAARSLLLENLPLLRERLAEHGMRVDQFDVDLSDRQAGGTPDGLQQNDRQHEDRPRAKAISHDPDDTPQSITSESPTKNGNEQLNIIV